MARLKKKLFLGNHSATAAEGSSILFVVYISGLRGLLG
jgi:hypothetical protein